MNSIALVTVTISGFNHAVGTGSERTGQLSARARRGWPNRAQRVDFLLLNAGMVPGKERVLTAAGVEAAQATLSGHHQLPVGLLHSPSN